MLSLKEMKDILTSVNPPDYIIHHMKRIVTSVDNLQKRLPLQDLKALDLGHDSYVGLLLSMCGLDLVGNIPPPELVGITAPTEQTNSFLLPNGKHYQWQLAPFDFQGRFPFNDNYFDLVTAFEVIEHISDNPRAVLKEINRVLKQSGYLYIGTPNICSLEKILRLINHSNPYDAKPFSQNFGPKHFMCHFYEYSTWELKEFIRSEGFEIISLRTWNPFATDPSPFRSILLKILFSISLMAVGHFRAGLLMYKLRGHQIGLLARKM